MAGTRNRRPREVFLESRKFDQVKFDAAMHRMANGVALTKICKEPGMPEYSALMGWILEDPKLYEKYARSKQMQADYYADETVEIADDDTNVPMARNRMDARRWHASKMNPRKYGERVTQDINANVTNTQRIDLSQLTAEARSQLRRTLVAQLQGKDESEPTYKVIK